MPNSPQKGAPNAGFFGKLLSLSGGGVKRGQTMSSGATREDVERCFFVFFGESKVAEERIVKRTGGDMRQFLSFCLRADKFTTAVVQPIATGATLPHYERGAIVPQEISEWLANRFDLPFIADELAKKSIDWRLFFLNLLLDIRFNDRAEEFGVQPSWISRLRSQAAKVRAEAPRYSASIRGSVDGFEGSSIRGWAFDSADPNRQLKIEVLGDNIVLGMTECDLFRRDVQEHFGGTGLCGFEMLTSPKLKRVFPSGSFILTARDFESKTPIGSRIAVELPSDAGAFEIAQLRSEIGTLQAKLNQLSAQLPRVVRQATAPVERFEDVAPDWFFISATERQDMRDAISRMSYRPRFSIVVPTFESDSAMLREALTSVRAQIYEDFELIISDGGSSKIRQISSVIADVFGEDNPKVVFKTSETRLGISANTNAGLAAVSGDYVVLLDHDDTLTEDALYWFAAELQDRRYKLIYSDEDRYTRKNIEAIYHTPFFKPDFDDELLLAQNYICHLVAIRKDVVDEVGAFDPEFDGAQDHDYMLRVTEKAAREDIRHVPKILYHWRTTEGSMSSAGGGNVGKIEDRISKLVGAHLTRKGAKASAANEVDASGKRRTFTTRIRWELPDPAPTVSLVIPTRDRNDLTGPCITSIQSTLRAYPGKVEILVMDNDSEELQTERYLQILQEQGVIQRHVWSGKFNWSAINNEGARKATGDIFVFLNNDTLVQTLDWLRELASLALREQVGAVGCRLLYEDGMIQHAGVLIGMGGVAGHDGLGSHSGESGYFGRNQLVRRVSAVTGACLAVRRSVFEAMNGFDEEIFGVAFNDVDFCLRLQEAGYANLYTPHATLFHFESKSRGFDTTIEKKERHKREKDAFLSRWSEVVNADPYYNVNFFRHGAPFRSIIRS